MKKIIYLFILLTFSSSLFALDSNIFSFRLTPRVELVNGVINEYVFDASCKNVDNKESQLDWDVKNIPVFGLSADLDIYRYVAISFDTSIGIPKISGYMQDYDWRNSLTTAWLEDDPTEITDYSIHYNDLKQYKNFNLSFGGNIFLPYNLKVTPFLAYQYEFIYFAGRNGLGRYKQATKTFKTTDYSQNNKVISYKQEINALFLGFSVEFDNIPNLFISADFRISPKMTFLNAVDYHYTRSLVFWDQLSNIWQIKANLDIKHKFNRHHRAGISSSLQYIPLSKGDTRSKYLNENDEPEEGSWDGPYKDGGGTSRLIWSLGINYSFSL